jgi:hypothetical protein
MLVQGNQGQTGKQVGQNLTVGFGEFSEQLVTELMARYYELTYRGQKFSACLTAAGTIGVLTLTGVTYHLYNPANSGKNLVIIASSFAPSSATFAVGAVFFAFNPQPSVPTATTPLAVRSNLLTGAAAASAAQVFSAATLASVPVAVRPFFGVPAVACTDLICVKDDVAGELILPPGGVLSIQANVAACAVGFLGMSWDEVAI